MSRLHRRHLLATSAFLLFGQTAVRAGIIHGVPWQPASGAPPRAVGPGPWHFFSAEEGRAMEAIVDRIIPPDPETPGGKGAGCAVYIDRQLAGPFGEDDGHYRNGPFEKGTKDQGDQSSFTPSQQYRSVLAALDAYCKATLGGRVFADLEAGDQDKAVATIENGDLKVDGIETKTFFNVLLKNTREGFFADPIYGGNKDMVGWKMIGFPGARYDYSDWIERHNEHYPHGPIGIAGAPSWSMR